MKTLSALLLLLVSLVSFSQQPQYSLFNHMSSFSNPALTGHNYDYYGGLSYRSNWIGFDGAPKITSALYEQRSEKIHGAAGVNVFSERLGFRTNMRLNLQYAYHLALGNSRFLSFGSAIGFHRMSPDGIINPTNPSTRLNINAGLAYCGQALTVGLGSTQITEPSYDYGNTELKPRRGYHFYSRYRLFISRSSMIQLSAQINTDLDYTTGDLNLKYYYKRQYWLGMSIRQRVGLVAMMGADIKEKVKLGIAYDMAQSSLTRYRAGALELFCAIAITHKPKKAFRRLITPAF